MSPRSCGWADRSSIAVHQRLQAAPGVVQALQPCATALQPQRAAQRTRNSVDCGSGPDRHASPVGGQVLLDSRCRRCDDTTAVMRRRLPRPGAAALLSWPPPWRRAPATRRQPTPRRRTGRRQLRRGANPKVLALAARAAECARRQGRLERDPTSRRHRLFAAIHAAAAVGVRPRARPRCCSRNSSRTARNTGERPPTHFSNVEGSKMSSLGLFRRPTRTTAATAIRCGCGGSSPGFNDNALVARDRHARRAVRQRRPSPNGSDASVAAGDARRCARKSRDR